MVAYDVDVTPEEIVQFNDYIIKYEKDYITSREYAFRLHIFVENLRYIQDANDTNLSINEFSDFTEEEIELIADDTYFEFE